MEPQEIFDTVAIHLLKQFKQAVHEEEGKPRKLMYRTPAGLRDSVGCFIPEMRYHPDMEGYALKGPSTWKQWTNNDGLTKLRDALIAFGVNVDDEVTMRLLTDLQRVHDNHEPQFWYDRLVATARAWRLSARMADAAARDFRRR